MQANREGRRHAGEDKASSAMDKAVIFGLVTTIVMAVMLPILTPNPGQPVVSFLGGIYMLFQNWRLHDHAMILILLFLFPFS
jgi:ABC-type amino acid transport system permease subunit